jgi:hypothetical protein
LKFSNYFDFAIYFGVYLLGKFPTIGSKRNASPFVGFQVIPVSSTSMAVHLSVSNH